MRSLIYIKKMRNLKYRRWKVSGKRDYKRITCRTGDRNATAPQRLRKETNYDDNSNGTRSSSNYDC